MDQGSGLISRLISNFRELCGGENEEFKSAQIGSLLGINIDACSVDRKEIKERLIGNMQPAVSS